MPIRNHMRITATALALVVGLTGGAQAEPFNIFSVSKAAEKADGATPQLDQVQYRGAVFAAAVFAAAVFAVDIAVDIAADTIVAAASAGAERVWV